MGGQRLPVSIGARDEGLSLVAQEGERHPDAISGATNLVHGAAVKEAVAQMRRTQFTCTVEVSVFT